MDKNSSDKKTVLCVDNEPTALIFYTKYLSKDYKLITCNSAEKGYAAAVKNLPDIIISDVVMPDISGIDFLEKIKSDPLLESVIFILASAENKETSDIVNWLKKGADDYLLKPVSKNILDAKLKSLLRIKNLQDSLHDSNKQLRKAMTDLKKYQNKLEEKNKILEKEKEMLENSLKQISLMAEEREKTSHELEQLHDIQKDNFNSLVKLLSELIESKRQYHRGHSKKVAEIAVFIAKEFGLDAEEIENIKIAALLHEIGKLSIPDELALKSPKNYTEQEKSFLLHHPVKGSLLLNKFNSLKNISFLIKHFHEHYDGTGVPDGLEKDNIPLGSKIISAANHYDNIVYRRKKGSIADAIESIEEKTGGVFDSRVIYYIMKFASKNPLKESEIIHEKKMFELEPGMELASAIFTKSGAKLLPKNTILDVPMISKISDYNKKDPLKDLIFIKSR